MKDHEEEVMYSLQGKYKHYCPDWDYMAIDENCPEFDACTCEKIHFKKGGIKDIDEEWASTWTAQSYNE